MKTKKFFIWPRVNPFIYKNEWRTKIDSYAKLFCPHTNWQNATKAGKTNSRTNCQQNRIAISQSRDMSVPNSLPIGISNGNDLIIIDYIEQILEFSNGELCPPFAFCHDEAGFCCGQLGNKHSHKWWGESMESWEGGRDSISSAHVAKAEKEGQHHLHVVPSSAMSLSPNQNVEKMLWHGAFMRLWFLLQISKSRLMGPRGPPRLTNLQQESQICNEFSKI